MYTKDNYELEGEKKLKVFSPLVRDILNFLNEKMERESGSNFEKFKITFLVHTNPL